MRLQGDSGLYLSGAQVKIPSCGIFITQPKIKEIVQFGEEDFLTAIKIIGTPEVFFSNAKKNNDNLKEQDNFLIWLEALKTEKRFEIIFKKFFSLCFSDYKIKYTNNSLNFSLLEDKEDKMIGIIQTYNFADFSLVVKELFNPPEEESESFNPKNELARKIAEKLEKARKRKDKIDQKNSTFQSVFGFYTSVLSIGLQIDINILYNYTPFQLYDCFSRFILKQEFDLYQKVILQPFTSTDSLIEPENWEKNLYK